MHQYHLGGLDDEKDGELVVSKIFYQTHPRQPSEGKKYGDPYEFFKNDNNSEVNFIHLNCDSFRNICYFNQSYQRWESEELFQIMLTLCNILLNFKLINHEHIYIYIYISTKF
jgi:hypothetical protein